MNGKRKSLLQYLAISAVALAAVSIFWPGQQAQAAASLWSAEAKSLYSATPKNWQVGDLVVVIIVEQATATQSAGTEAQKTSGLDAELDLNVGIPLEAADADLSGGNGLKASGKTVRGGTLRAQITAQVMAVLPNGCLHIEGRQKILVNGEQQEISLAGIVRQQDISRDNTVLSTLIADAEITYKGVGVIADKQTQGLITRFWNWLF